MGKCCRCSMYVHTCYSTYVPTRCCAMVQRKCARTRDRSSGRTRVWKSGPLGRPEAPGSPSRTQAPISNVRRSHTATTALFGTEPQQTLEFAPERVGHPWFQRRLPRLFAARPASGPSSVTSQPATSYYRGARRAGFVFLQDAWREEGVCGMMGAHQLQSLAMAPTPAGVAAQPVPVTHLGRAGRAIYAHRNGTSLARVAFLAGPSLISSPSRPGIE